MKIRKIRKHLNNGNIGNEGFSLIELIVTIAIMIVFVAVVIISTSVIDTSRVKEVERGIDDFAGMARSKSMSVSAKAWYMEVTTIDGDYVTKLCRVDETDAVNGVKSEYTTNVDIETYNNKVKVSFSDYVSTYKIDNSAPLRVYFNSSTGKVSQITVNNVPIDISNGVGKIMIDAESYNATLKFFYNTGKIERE